MESSKLDLFNQHNRDPINEDDEEDDDYSLDVELESMAFRRWVQAHIDAIEKDKNKFEKKVDHVKLHIDACKHLNIPGFK
jgi:hypothetical protein